ncbi:hypothetical protein NQ317_014085 [Molorchus minor]|uniref:CCAAT-binding factor domain-containing protein n=1 Tax=Molorchus minor TaxID=1323400 RepID=A0ABQ9JH09_9CUCU|nr:hypothetical protein NQ317_014085 [Molorchus minor]
MPTLPFIGRSTDLLYNTEPIFSRLVLPILGRYRLATLATCHMASLVNKMKGINKTKFKIKDANNDEEHDFEQYEEPKKWFEELPEDPKDFKEVTEQILIEVKDEAKKCHDTEVANFNAKISKTNPNYQWMKTVMTKGTISDKIAAHTLSIQDNPVCNLERIRNLVGMVKVGKKKECTAVIDTLRELFLTDLLLPNRKLKSFHQRPLSLLNKLSSGNAITRRKLLSIWYFEDQLKEIYTQFVLALNTVSHDTVDNNKEKAISAMYKLLAGNCEQEKNLLTYIVNKLGDPSQKVASKAIYCLTQLLSEHSNMQEVVLNEIEKLLFRPNISTKAQYYSLCFLSQYHLSHEACDVARRLIEVYFSFFKSCVKKGEVDSRMMSALLMGINRAYPYAKLEFEKVSEHIDTMYRLVHMANFNISLQTLTVLYQVSDIKNTINDRFYSALYKKLADPQLIITTHQAMLLSLIYKALLKDTEVNRVKMFVKRLLQISLYTQPSFTCGIMYLVSQLIGKKKDALALILKQATVDGLDEDDDEGEEKYHDVKEEVDVDECQSIEIKQEVEDVEIKEEIAKEDNTPTTIDAHPIEIKDEPEDSKPDVELLDVSLNGAPSWYHCRNTMNKQKPNSHSKYDALTRNPLYGGGEFCGYIELYMLKNYFHPTISLYASYILNGESVRYSGDPLKDFTLIRFLDRFVFKNPKKVEGKLGVDPTFGKRKLYRPKGVKLLNVNSAGYLKESQQNIPEDELFVYSYLQQKYRHRKIEEEDDSDLESVQSEEFEEMLDKMAGVKDDDEDIDFMVGNKDEDEESDEDISDEDDSIDEADFDDDLDDELNADEFGELADLEEDDKELIGGLDDDDDEDIEFLEDDVSKKSKKNKFKKNGEDLSSLFASAEEFATLLEEEGSSKVKPGGSNVYSNKDKADAKQIAWEDKRNVWLKGFNRVMGSGGGKKFGSKGKQFGNKRPHQSNKGNKQKKLKK